MVIKDRPVKTTFSIADAKAHLSELAERAATGETLLITRRGRPVARVSPADRPRRPVDAARLGRLTDRIAHQAEDAAGFTRRMREDQRY